MATIEELMQKGVDILCPSSVYIDEHVDIDRIAGKGVQIHPGCRIHGKRTVIMEGACLGHEGPVTVENSLIGPHVQLKGGYFKESVFWDHSSFGLGGHAREGTILEEYAKAAHTVGLKQTILFPYVVLGSLINFCDCLLAGGTSFSNHSEVGSSYIHFNFTPHQDKATASLMGDVPLGVMLNQPPIFLGGQGGVVGPCRMTYGVIVGAGSVVRHDLLEKDVLVIEKPMRFGEIKFIPGQFNSVKRITKNNLIYIANLIALKNWYSKVRSLFINGDLGRYFWEGSIETLDGAINERQQQFRLFCEKVGRSHDLYGKDLMDSLLKQKKELWDRHLEIDSEIDTLKRHLPDFKEEADFLLSIQRGIREKGTNYIDVIKSLQSEDSRIGTLWLQHIVDYVTASLFKLIPLFS